ncbi:hypothetical protein DFJ77DRAFT_143895 [Powellomyces hirtus]|nr:hypothetical protein DFJ77DRAFT_143895 [Powellomyces hirtus]
MASTSSNSRSGEASPRPSCPTEDGRRTGPQTIPCNVCGKPANFMCSKCGVGYHYCSSECQTRDWNSHHKYVCVGMRSSHSHSPRTIFPEVVVEANPSSPSLAQPSTTSPVMPPADFSARPPSAPARGRIRNRRRRIQGRGNVAQPISSIA